MCKTLKQLNYIYSCISFDLNPVFFWKNTEIMLTKQIGVPEAWLIWMTDFLPCFNAQLLCWLNVRRHFVRNVCDVRMDILSGWTFCQWWTFCQEETFCKEDLLSGLHFQGKTQVLNTFEQCLNTFEHTWTSLEHIWTSFKHIWTRFEHLWTHFNRFWTHLNTLENMPEICPRYA